MQWDASLSLFHFDFFLIFPPESNFLFDITTLSGCSWPSLSSLMSAVYHRQLTSSLVRLSWLWLYQSLMHCASFTMTCPVLFFSILKPCWGFLQRCSLSYQILFSFFLAHLSQPLVFVIFQRAHVAISSSMCNKKWVQQEEKIKPFNHCWIPSSSSSRNSSWGLSEALFQTCRVILRIS